MQIETSNCTEIFSRIYFLESYSYSSKRKTICYRPCWHHIHWLLPSCALGLGIPEWFHLHVCLFSTLNVMTCLLFQVQSMSETKPESMLWERLIDEGTHDREAIAFGEEEGDVGSQLSNAIGLRELDSSTGQRGVNQESNRSRLGVNWETLHPFHHRIACALFEGGVKAKQPGLCAGVWCQLILWTLSDVAYSHGGEKYTWPTDQRNQCLRFLFLESGRPRPIPFFF